MDQAVQAVKEVVQQRTVEWPEPQQQHQQEGGGREHLGGRRRRQQGLGNGPSSFLQIRKPEKQRHSHACTHKANAENQQEIQTTHVAKPPFVDER
ncbi:hypothetical protein ACVC7V_06145 [Hydrogenophaga sp. A37]